MALEAEQHMYFKMNGFSFTQCIKHEAVFLFEVEMRVIIIFQI